MGLDISAIYGVNGVQQQGPDLATIYGEAAKIQQFKQQRAEQNALKALFANPQNLGPDGMPNQNAIKQLLRASPSAGMGLMEEEAKIDEQRALAHERQQKSALERDNYLNTGVRQPAMAAYEKALRDGKTEEQARDVGQHVYSDSLKEASGSGLFSDDEAAKFDPKFDPERVQQRIKQNAGLNGGVKGADIETLTDSAGNTFDHNKVTGRNSFISGPAGQKSGSEYDPSGGTHKIGGASDTGELSDAGVAYFAEQYRTLGPNSLGRLSKADRAKVINRAAQESGGDAEGDIRTQFGGKGAQAEQRAEGTRIGQLRIAENEMEGAVKISQAAYAKLPRGKFTPFNELANLYEKKTSSPEQAAAYAADNAIVNLYARMISPTGQGTDSDKNHAREMLNQAQGPEAHQAVLQQLLTEGQNAIRQAKGAREQTTAETPVAKHAPAAGRPPVPDAHQAPDGHWYVKKGGRFFRVEE